MKYLALVLTLACVQCSVPATAIELSASGVVVLSASEMQGMQHCAVMGGCAIITRAELMRFVTALEASYVEAAAEVAKRAIAEHAKTCRREI